MQFRKNAEAAGGPGVESDDFMKFTDLKRKQVTIIVPLLPEIPVQQQNLCQYFLKSNRNIMEKYKKSSARLVTNLWKQASWKFHCFLPVIIRFGHTGGR